MDHFQSYEIRSNWNYDHDRHPEFWASIPRFHSGRALTGIKAVLASPVD